MGVAVVVLLTLSAVWLTVADVTPARLPRSTAQRFEQGSTKAGRRPPGPPSLTCTDHFFPWLSVDPNGGVHLGWYDRRLRPRQPVDYSMTDTYGASFAPPNIVSPNVRLTSCTFSTDVTSACTSPFGDYNGGFATASKFYFAWGDGRNGDPDAFSGGICFAPSGCTP
jgi:hypothetical protein